MMDEKKISEEFEELPSGQLSLLPESMTEPMLQERETVQGIYSGVGLKAADPRKYMVICNLLADGSLSQRKISRLTGVSRNLISAINRQAADIEPLKKKIAAQYLNVSMLCAERIEEILQDPNAKISIKDLGIVGGIGIEKSQLLSGEATQRVERIESDPGMDAFNADLEALPLADVIEERSAMGCDGGKLTAKWICSGAMDAAPGDDDDGANDPAGDAVDGGSDE